MASNSFTPVDNYYRAAASQDVAPWNYKGLEVHAVPIIHEEVAKIVTSALPRGSKVLDIAAGSGAMCLRLKDLGMVPTGTDLVTENFRLHGEVPIIRANFNEELPPELRGKFDCATATELIEHLENTRHFVRQCYEMLKPGGLLILSTPNTEFSISVAQFVRSGEFRWFMPEHYKGAGHIMPILLPVLRNALLEAGFINIKVQAISPLKFPGLLWWKMRVLAWLIRRVMSRPLLEGDFLVVQASKPA